jgi:hypothetical protein
VTFPQQLLLGAPIGTTAGWVLGQLAVVFPSDADLTLTTSGTTPQSTNNALQATSSVPLTDTRQLIVPLSFGQPYTVQNNTTGGQSILVIGPTGTGVLVPPGETVLVVCDGTNYDPVLGGVPGQPSYNPPWYALTDIYLDPVAGLDTNSGQVGFPVQTMAEVIQRYGTSSPQIPHGQNLTIHQLSAQTSGVDFFYFDPQMSGSCFFNWIATNSVLVSAFSPATVVPRSQTSGGTGYQLTGCPAGTVSGTIVFNVTKGSYAIGSAFAAGTLTVSQPVLFTLNSLPPSEDNTWANTDSYELLSFTMCNWCSPQPRGTGRCFAWIQGVLFSEAGDDGAWTLHPFGITTILAICDNGQRTACLNGTDATQFITTGLFNKGLFGLQCIACTMETGTFTFEAFYTRFFGCNLIASVLTACQVDGDSVCNSVTVMPGGESLFGPVQVAGTLVVDAGFLKLITIPSTGTLPVPGLLWGAGSLNVSNGAQFELIETSLDPQTWTSSLVIPTIQLEGAATGTVYNKDAVGDQFTPGFAITPTNLDAYNGLQNPLTNARFFNPNGTSVSDNWYSRASLFLDPVSGLDTNTGITSGSPVKTMAEVVRRYGTTTPVLLHSLTVTQLSSQSGVTDTFVFNPVFITNGSVFLWDGLTHATQVGANFSPTTVVAKTQSATGNTYFLQGTLPSASDGSIVHNVTKGSYAAISNGTSGQYSITQPLKLTSNAIAEDNTWATTDTYQTLTPLTCNWSDIEPLLANVSTIQGLTFQGPTSLVRPKGETLILWSCIRPGLILDGTDATRGLASSLASSMGLNVWGCYQDQGAYFTRCNISGGIFADDSNNVAFDSCALDCDIILDCGVEPVLMTGSNYLGAVFNEDFPLQLVGGSAIIAAIASTAIVYGSTLNVTTRGILENGTGGTFANCLKMTTLQLDGVATGSSFNSAAANNPFTSGISLTSANLDTGGGAGNPGLQNPRTGSRYAST